MFRNRLLFPLFLVGVAACDNVGRAFDPDVDSDNPGTQTGTSVIQVVPVGGDVRDGRPVVKATYPEGAGWPSSVPVVVEFNESVSQEWLAPTSATGTDGRIGVRVQGTTQLLPCQYDFLAGNRLLVMRPLNGLPDSNGAVYEVVLLPDARDVDGVRFAITGGERVLSDFQTNQDPEQTDGRILALFPRDNSSEMTREGNFWVVFDRPGNASTLVEANVFLRTPGGAAINATVGPLSTNGLADTRVLRIDPAASLASSARYELVVTDAITFGQDGTLDFRGRTPFARFDTVGPAVPTAIALDSPLTGFPNKINRQNVATAALAVTTPTDTLVGDQVRARIYGGDAGTTPTFDLTFVERQVTVPAAGAQTVTIDFTGLLGSIGSPRLDDGSVTFAAEMKRGAATSGFVYQTGTDEARFDVTPPTLDRAGPPASGDGADLFTDQEYVAFDGLASEAVAGADLADGVNPTTTIWASNGSGRFTVKPIALGRLPTPRAYTLTLTDDSGNLAAATAAGRIVQRGLVTGTLAGTVVVEAYDEATLQPIANATVLLDAPAAAQQLGTTDESGRVSFSSAAAAHTVTIVRAGYGLFTLADTQAGFLSLPLRANASASATATLAATITNFQPAPGRTALLSNSAFVDGNPLGIESTSTSPNELPRTAILPNRQQIITAFGGTFEPTSVPTYSLQGSQLLGATLTVPTVPGAPATPGSESTQALLVLAVDSSSSLVAPADEDFASATGLDLGDLVGGQPRVRVTASLNGFGGQVLTGVGAVVATAGTQYSVQASWSLPIIAGFAEFTPTSWLVIDALDNSGRRSRSRRLLPDPTAGNVSPGLGPTAIPVITTPSGPSTGGPLVEFADVLAPVPGIGIFTCYEVTATDATGRRWSILVPDRDAAGGVEQVQFPAFTAANVAGLAAGSWSVVVEARAFLMLTAASIDDFVLAERIRQEVNYARSRTVTFTVQ